MKKVWICLLMVVVLSFLTVPSFADTVDVTFTGVTSGNVSDNGLYYISPYYLTVNGTTEAAYCIDYNHWIVSGETWKANTTLASGPSFANTYNPGNPIVYQEMGYLVSQYILPANAGQQAAIQQAIWDISAGGTPFGLTGQTAYWYYQAINYSSGWDGSGWTILTDVNNTAFSAQEFLIQTPVATPEPGTIMLLGSGILGVYGFSRKKRTQLET
ncbi:MAG: PEP-CTERM sorting domain-containing protein [Thermodesulfobacteriota bacterium]|jgi:hypothetical protein